MPSEAPRDADISQRVYDELRELAGALFRWEREAHTLQATALVHEAYLRLAGRRDVDIRDRAQFRAVAARAMRRVLVDHARRRDAAKRGGGMQRVTLDEGASLLSSDPVDVLTIDEALNQLREMNSRHAQVVELRFFGGLTNREVAELLGVTTTTIENDWAMARAWLRRKLATGEEA